MSAPLRTCAGRCGRLIAATSTDAQSSEAWCRPCGGSIDPPQPVLSVLTIEIPINHGPQETARDLADGILSNLPQEWFERQDEIDLCWIDPADLSRAIHQATLTEAEVQS